LTVRLRAGVPRIGQTGSVKEASMTIEKMDKAALKLIADMSQTALDAVAEELGITVKIGGGSYDPAVGTFKPKVTFSLGNAEQLAFERTATLIGLEPEDYGKTFEHNGHTYKLVAINLRAPRFPVLAEREDGKQFKFPEASIRTFLGRLKNKV
jgi:hypothetical protein